jgi:hypothetical protein
MPPENGGIFRNFEEIKTFVKIGVDFAVLILEAIHVG